MLLNFFMNSVSNVAQILLILRNILYIVCLGSCLDLGLFMPYLCDLFFTSNLIFSTINHITSVKQTHFFKNIFFYFWMIPWIKKTKNFQITKVQPQGVAELLLNFFSQFQSDLAYKSVAYKKSVYLKLKKFHQSYIVNMLNIGSFDDIIKNY